jgi:hypothetical protein
MTMTVAETATLAHGYTMAEIDRLSDVAVAMAGRMYRGTMLDATDRKEAAWFGIVDMLYSATSYPDGYTLIQAGTAAIRTETNQAFRHGGVDKNSGADAANFAKYWLPVTRPSGDFTDGIVERMALPPVLGVLTAPEYEAIAALATYGSQKAGAEALGIQAGAFSGRIQRARRRIVEVWLEHETPANTARRSTSDEQCAYGHDRAEHGYKDPKKGWWRCRVCVRNGQRRHRAR